MSQAPRQLLPSRSAADYFGAQLRHWRQLRGLSQQQLGRLTLHSGSLICKVEKAERTPPPDLARRCDDVLQTGGALQRLNPRASVDAQQERSAVPAVPCEVGLAWSSDLADTVEVAGQLWRADVERRKVVISAAWSAAAFAAPARDWLAAWTEPNPTHAGGRRVGAAEVDVVWSMCGTFANLDHQLGGGHARTTLAHYLSTAVLPMLKGSYSQRTGKQLLAATARLCDIGGFMAFDCRRPGLAQRYYIQALRLAKDSGDRSIGAHILADMSMQAQYMGDGREALALARAGQRTARDCGSSLSMARCCALEARAHALLGDGGSCGQAMTRAERALTAATDEEPSWVTFFTSEQLAAEFMYAAGELGRHADVQRFAPAVLASSAGMQRRLALATATLASSYLPGDGSGNHTADIDQACEVLRTAVPVAATLASPRTVNILHAVRAQLRAHRSRPAVEQLDSEMESVLGAAS